MTRTRSDLVFIVGLVALLFAAMGYSSAFASDTGAYVLTSKQVSSEISKHLAHIGAGEKVKATITGAPNTVYVRHDKPLMVEIDDLSYKANSLQWTAQMKIFAEEKLLQHHDLAGRFVELVPVPVLTKRLGSDDVITDTDIVWKDVPEDRLRKDTIIEAETLLGMSPRRVISQNRPIRSREITRPTLVEKGKLVQVHFYQGGMHIRTLAEAREDGALGDVIRVRNVDSGSVLQAKVTSSTNTEVLEYERLSANQYR